MTICSIEIRNLLSFDHLVIDDIHDLNCIVGKNNTGKSNLLKLIKYFYHLLEGGREVPPKLNSNYSSFGSIAIEYDTTRIRKIITSKNGKKNTPYFKHIFNTLFSGHRKLLAFGAFYEGKSTLKLTLTINKDDSIQWSTSDRNLLHVIRNLYPFFEIQTRHIDLYDWNKLWDLISRLKSFRVTELSSEDVVDFFNKKLSNGGNDYKDYVDRIKTITQTAEYSYSEKVLNYVKVGLEGHSFTNDGEDLKSQSDGSNSYRYIEWFLSLLISLTRRDYITPTVYIDEPEIGLHPKLNEQLIKKLNDVYESFKKTKDEKELGRYATPYPKVIISTHSPNIVKSTIKLFPDNHKIYHFSKTNGITVVKKMASQYDNPKFLNIFSDNEARLFFSEFILFVEGTTEVELFGNVKLGNKFKNLERADIYQTDLVALGGINPEFSNASIPYLVLYDLDVIIEIDFAKKRISLKSKKININKFLESCKFSYFGSKKYDLKKNIEQFEGQVNSGTTLFDNNFIHIESIGSMENGIEELVALLNYRILSNFNYMVTLSTIEGTLINRSSFMLFIKWLKWEIIYNLNIRNAKGTSKKVSSTLAKTNTLDLNKVTDAIKIIFEPNLKPYDIDNLNNEKEIRSLKFSYLKLLNREIHSKFSSRRDLEVALRLIFNGKTGSLVSIENNTKKKIIAAPFMQNVTDLKNHLRPLNHLFADKTSGWVTRFMNYSLDEVERIEKKFNDNQVFQKKFPELYDIIERLQPR